MARFNGGHNAGHTLVVGGTKFAFHILPCGLLTPGKTNVIGNGVVVNVPNMLKELDQLDAAGIEYESRLLVSDRAHLLFDFHTAVDAKEEEARTASASIGTTRRGIGPCYASKITRNGVRVGELRDWDSFERKLRALAADVGEQHGVDTRVEDELARFRGYRERLLPWVRDTAHYVNTALAGGARLLCEGANAVLLDVDHGTYPYVTSSATAAGGVCTGLGLPPSAIESTIAIVKAYCTRVGAGPFPTELECEQGEHLRSVGNEYGTTTGRPRRCGWLDVPAVRYGAMVNGYTSLNLTKLDVLSGMREVRVAVAYELDGERVPDGMMPSRAEELARVRPVYETMPGWEEDISGCRTFEQLPANARAYVERVEELTQTPVGWIGVGPGREEMATRGFTL